MKLDNIAAKYLLMPILLGLLSVSLAGQASDCKIVNTQLNSSSFICGESPIAICADGIITSGILKGTKIVIYTAGTIHVGGGPFLAELGSPGNAFQRLLWRKLTLKSV